ncbi:MAG: divergent polysaccharide deacetylase family protein [Mariprofundaceae bacterium]|nr:divergent polysaccharide deacetylase family protein [Mariprofundaceae bacterium]
MLKMHALPPLFVLACIFFLWLTTPLQAQDWLKAAPQSHIVEQQINNYLPSTPTRSLLSSQQNIAIIMDDLGYRLSDAKALLALAFPVTFAVIPHTPFATEVASQAHQAGRTVILHQPMETSNPKYHDINQVGLLYQGMTREHFVQVLEANIASVPYVSGLNNHMGSLLTSLDEPMQWVMEVSKKHQLYFVDSRTTHKTVAIAHAQREGVVWAERKVFLDASRDIMSIKKAWQKALRYAKKGQQCIVIAHPYPETLAFLKSQVSHRDIASLRNFLHVESQYADAKSY